MGKELSLFSDYQGENAVTNYCGLILRLLYDESPLHFGELMGAISDGMFAVRTGPVFSQQHGLAESTPDLFIQQRGFSILVETKLYDWYHKGQLDRHIKGLQQVGGQALMLALSNFESDEYRKQFQERFKSSIEIAEAAGIHTCALSFEHFLAKLRGVAPSPRFRQMVAEFRRYLEGKGLLPKWQHLLDVVSCRLTQNEIAMGAYICPDTGGGYSHRRAKYLGAYTGNKKVTAIHEIRALVVLAAKGAGIHVRWKNVNVADDLLAQDVRRIFARCEPSRQKQNQEHAQQFFLLSEGHHTNFSKDTRGGMLHSKLYFRNIAKDVKDTQALAAKLNGKKWSDFLK